MRAIAPACVRVLIVQCCDGLISGKSTAIAILTGLFPPTSGDAFVNGYSVLRDIRDVHRFIGVCPQFSILWEQLTVREHLLFFARLKGIDWRHETAHVHHALVDYGLVREADRMAGALSGGMKRRLCVAIALVGGSKAVFLGVCWWRRRVVCCVCSHAYVSHQMSPRLGNECACCCACWLKLLAANGAICA